MQLSILIVNYNVKYFLEQCLLSALKACSTLEAEIVVVDNCSTDGSRFFFTNRFPSVRFIWNNENVGFAKANNQALQYCSGEYILFLNPDTIVAEDCFEKCIAFFQLQQKQGALGIRLIDGSGKFLKESKRGFPSLWASMCKLSGLTSVFPDSKLFSKYYLGHLEEHQNHEVDVLPGAFMLIPKKVLQTVGSFDEQFFMYGEDIDLSYRIQKAGYKNYYFCETSVIHFKGESTKKGSLLYIRIFYKAMILFVHKHFKRLTVGVFTLFIKIAGGFSATIALIVVFFKKIFFVFIKNKASSTLLLGGEKETNTLAALLKTIDFSNKIMAYPYTAHSLKGLPDKNFEALERFIKIHSVEAIIFCEGVLMFKEMMNMMERLSGTVRFQFYAADSNGILCSNDKNTGGDVIVLARR